ncbi:MAG TPA: hypothetical protein VGJ25_01690 [Gaiellaceae bacterium]|jgi:hypothetical protein
MARARRTTRFDPYAILEALERERVTYILIGGLARVIEGSDELTRGVDVTPSTRPENLRRLEAALRSLDARPRDGRSLSLAEIERAPPLALESDHGEINIVPVPDGTRGYDDLRRAVRREPIGRGLRVPVASPGDLVRMLSALGREQDALRIETMQRVVERDRGLIWER